MKKCWLSAILVAFSSLSMAQFSWTNTSGGNWNVGSNWLGGTAPAANAGTDVFIDYPPFSITGSTGAFQTSLTYSTSIARLFSRANFRMTTGSSLTLNSTGSIIDGAFVGDVGSVFGGSIVLNGTSSFANTGTFIIQGTSLTLNGSGSIGANTLRLTNSTVGINSLLTVTDSTVLDGIINVGSSGTYRKSTGAGIHTVSNTFSGGTIQFNNAGAVESTSGDLRLVSTGTHTGFFRGSGGTVTFASNTHNILGATFESGAQISGGIVRVADTSTLNLVGTPTFITGTLEATGTGRLAGAGTLVINSPSSVNLGTIRNDANVAVQSGSVRNVNGVYTNAGTTTVNGGVIWNDGIINNLGSLIKSGSGNASLNVPFNGGANALNSSGSISSTGGNLLLRAGGTHTGSFQGSGGTVIFSAGNHSLNAGHSLLSGSRLDGAALFAPASGSYNINGAFGFDSGTINGANVSWVGPGSLNFDGTGSMTIAGTHTNSSVWNVNSSSPLTMVNNTVTNAGTINFNSGGDWRDGILVNSGSILKTGAGETRISLPFNGGPRRFDNSGTVLVSNGIMSTVTGGTHSGQFEGTGSGQFVFRGGVHGFVSGSTLKSGVVLEGSDNVIDANVNLNIGGVVTMTGGTLRSADGANPGSVLGGVGGELRIEAPSSVNLQSVMSFNVPFKWNGGVIAAVNSTITNQGTISIASNTDWRDGILNNLGTITKTSAGETKLNLSFNGGPRAFNNSGTVNVNAGTLRISTGGTHSGAVNANGGTVLFNGETQVLQNGTIMNGVVNLISGTWNVPAGQSPVFNGTTWSGGNLNGAGTLTGPDFTWTSGVLNLGGTLTNQTELKWNDATIAAANSTFTNNSLINSNGPAATVYRDGILVNNGEIRASNGTLNLVVPFNGGPRSLQNNGLILANGGNVVLPGTGTHSGAFRTNGANTITFSGETHTFRTGSILGTGTITTTPCVVNETVEIEGESEFRNSTWSGSGTVKGDLWRWSTLNGKTLAGSLTIEADVAHEGGDLTLVNSTHTFRGTTTLTDAANWRDGIQINEGTFQKIAGAGITTIGAVSSGGPRSFTNTGKLFCSSGLLNMLGPLTNYSGAMLQMNGGTYSVAGTGRLKLPVSDVVVNSGRFEFDGPSSTIVQNDNVLNVLRNLAENRGGLQLTNGASLVTPAGLLNSGDVVIGTSSTLDPAGNYSQTAGLTRVNGSLQSPVLQSGGILAGIGTVVGNSTFTGGSIAPGNSTGVLNITGTADLTGTSVDIEVAGSGSGQFDRVNVSGAVNLVSGNALLADAAPNSTVATGTTVDVVLGSSVNGTFATVPNPADWSVIYGSNFVRLTANRTIFGPVLISGQVDLNGWIASYTTVPLTFELKQNGVVIESFTQAANAARRYSLSTRLRGTYDLEVVGSHWLRKRLPTQLNITDAGLSFVDFALINGDVDGNNEIGPADFAVLANSFGSETGDPNFVEGADLDGNGEIGPADFAILSTNFGLEGDS